MQTELRTIMNYFPGKLVHIGFFTVEDDLDPTAVVSRSGIGFTLN